MTAVLVLIILGVVIFVLYDIARITAKCGSYAFGDERAPELADQPATEEAGQPKIGARSSDANGS